MCAIGQRQTIFLIRLNVGQLEGHAHASVMRGLKRYISSALIGGRFMRQGGRYICTTLEYTQRHYKAGNACTLNQFIFLRIKDDLFIPG
jgi:hypothetical protein